MVKDDRYLTTFSLGADDLISWGLRSAHAIYADSQPKQTQRPISGVLISRSWVIKCPH